MTAVTVTVSNPFKTVTATTTITVSSGTTVNVGQTSIGTINDNTNGNVIIAQPVTLTQTGTLLNMSVYVQTAGGQLRLGVYKGATPTTLVATTNAFTPSAGWNTQVAPSVALSPGQYWLTTFSQLNTLTLRKATSASTVYYKTGQTFGALPTTFPSTPNTETSLWSIYGTFSVGPPPPPDTTPPSIPTNLTATNA